TQSTELGTVYTPDEVRAIADHAHGLGMRVHMDGARIANAAASLGVPLRAFTRDAGVDVLSFGGTKNGAMLAEAIVVLDAAASEGLRYLRKLDMQLSSKMRFVSAQLLALIEGDLWLRNASHANAMAARLRQAVEAGIADGRIRGAAFTQPTQANALFATLPAGVADRLREKFRFYDWDASRGEVRWVCSFDTTADDVDAFAAELARLT
ncbi:MAG: threonine aldolase, partial [Microbacterium sp.]|uniref:threonine aldolase family protein n=1 Tax=Microbacterium sp. TaxID=51671 RepID=UPI000DB3ABE3